MHHSKDCSGGKNSIELIAVLIKTIPNTHNFTKRYLTNNYTTSSIKDINIPPSDNNNDNKNNNYKKNNSNTTIIFDIMTNYTNNSKFIINSCKSIIKQGSSDMFYSMLTSISGLYRNLLRH
ncbi:hypothetical protein ACTFIU_010968 [Dictyostelium citrinum]